jgi:hypothetical protein
MREAPVDEEPTPIRARSRQHYILAGNILTLIPYMQEIKVLIVLESTWE